MSGLDPSDEVTKELEAPVNKSGKNCPLYRKPVHKVCHNCEFWRSARLNIKGQEAVVWNCALNWAVSFAAKNTHATEMVEKETTLMRNKFTGFEAGVNSVVEGLARANLVLAHEVKQLRAEDGQKAIEHSGPA